MTSHTEPSVRNWRVTVLISGSGSNLQALLDATQLPASDPHSLAHCTITAVLSSRSDAYGLVRARSFAPSPTPAEAFPLLRWKKAPENQGKTRDDWEQDLAARIRQTRPDVVVLAGWMLILGERFLNALVRDWDENASPSPTSSPPLPSFDPSGATVGSGLSTPCPSPYAPAAQEALKGRPIPIINLHPALPGQFPGAHAIRDAWDAFNLPVESSLSSSASAASATLEALGTADPAVEAKTGGRRIDKTGIMIHRVIPLLDAGRPVVVKEVPMVEGESLEGLETRIHEVEHGAIVEAVGEVVRLIRDGAWWDEEDTGRTTGEQ